MHRKDILFKEFDLYLSCGPTWLLYSSLLSFSPFWWKVKESFTDRVSMPNKPLFKMPSVRLTDIWTCISVICSHDLCEAEKHLSLHFYHLFCDFSSCDHLMSNYLGFVLCTDLSLLISSCQTLVNFCIRSSVKNFDLLSWWPDSALEIHRRRGLNIKILHLWTGSGNHAKSLKFTRLMDYNVISPLEVLLYVFLYQLFVVFVFCFSPELTVHDTECKFNKVPAKVLWPCFIVSFHICEHEVALQEGYYHRVLQNRVWRTCGSSQFGEIYFLS